jgi:RNA polymerase sigma-54 factor
MGKDMNPHLFLKMAPERRLMMTFGLRQALEILQMPQQDLAQWLLNEIEKNPLLELDSIPSKKKFEGEAASPLNLYDHLLTQIREHFPNAKERKIAEEFLTFLDDRGFISCPLEEIELQFPDSAREILKILQTFDPPGIFASNLQEALILQLRAKGKSFGLAHALVQDCYDDLLHGRYTAIKKKLGPQDLNAAIDELSRLSMRPAHLFKYEPSVPVYPDLRIDKVEGGWTLELVEDELPLFHIQTQYLDLETHSNEEKESLRNFKTQAKWICRSIERRRKILREIGRILICKQAVYLDQKGPLAPLGMKELSEKLGIHESTLSRALSNKYASTPIGMIPLRSLISADPAAENARQMLQQLIEMEDKKYPCTDEDLAKELRSKGFKVARRTIAKYRNQLKIGSASQRKHR